MNDSSSVVHLVAAVCGDRVRVLAGGAGPTLPTTDGPRQYVHTSQVLAAAGDAEGSLMAPAVVVQAEPAVVLHAVDVRPDPAADWLPLEELHRLAHPAGVAHAVRLAVEQYTGAAALPDLRPDWFTRAWRGEVYAWVDRQLSGLDLVRAGPGELVKQWSLSAVLRIPVESRDRPSRPRDLFFKATSGRFHAEPAITELLSRLRPGAVPDVLAVRAERAWMLMEALSIAADGTEPEAAPAAARSLAGLQFAAVDRRAELLAVGAEDRTLGPTWDQLSMVVSESVELDLLSREERAAARSMLGWLQEQLVALEATGLPYSVGHGDLHLGNVADGDGRAVLYDWSDAAITFPVLDVVLLARSAGPEVREATLAAYAEVWRAGYPEASVSAALRLAPLVNEIYQAVSYELIYRTQEVAARAEMGGVVARNLRDLARQWADRPVS